MVTARKVVLPPSGDARKVALRLPKAPPVFTEVIKMTAADVGWGTPDAGNKPIVANATFTIRKGQRVLVSLRAILTVGL